MKLYKDKQKSLDRLNILLKLKETVTKDTVMGEAILNAFEDDNYSLAEILGFIKDQARDSFKTMAEAIGEDLCNDILNL